MLKKSMFLLLCLVTSTHAIAANWRFELSPLLWNLNMSGEAQVRSKKALVDRTKLGGMVRLQINRNEFGFFINSIYSKISETQKYGPIAANVSNKYGVFTAGLLYTIYSREFSCFSDQCIFYLEPFVGARYTIKDTDLTASVFGSKLNASHHNNWLDPLAGIQANLLIASEWLIFLNANAGGKNTNTRYGYNVIALLGYQPKQFAGHASVQIGYQILDQHYTAGQGADFFKWDMKLAGPLFGISIIF